MDYSEIAFGPSQPSSGVPRTPEQAAADLAKAQATFGAIGINVGSITKGLNIPQQGFTDPRSSAQLVTAPAFPAKREENTDGSGVNTINQPAQRNPQLTGFPSVSPLAINDAKLEPSQVTEKLKSLITDISGPKAGSLTVDIAGGAAGPATLLNGGDLTSKLNSLLPSVGSLSGSIVHLGGAVGVSSAQQGQAAADFAMAQSTISQGISGVSLGTNAKFNSALDSLVSLPSKLTGGTITSLNPSSLTSSVTSGVSGALNKITPEQLTQANADFAKAQATIAEGFGNANDSATSMQAKAQESLSNKLNLGNLRGGAGNIADRIFEKLKAFTPANVSTKIPVVGISEIKTPAAATGVTTATDPVPNPIPATVPLYKVDSSQKKSIENCIQIFEEYVSKRLNEINQTLYATKTKKEYQAAKAQLALGNSKTASLIEQLVSSAGNDGPELRTTLNAIKQDYTARINEGLTQYYDTLPQG